MQHAVVDKMTQVSVGYPESPLNGASFDGHGPQPGERIIPAAGQVPIGAGNTPRFALLAAPSSAVSDLIAKFPQLLESAARTSPAPSGAWLVRPDGYAAAVASAENLILLSHKRILRIRRV